jgi:rhodanese-related sulfurtransferase
MLKRLLTITLLSVAVAFAGPAWSYDTAMAASYAKLFAPVKGAGAGMALHLIAVDDFVEDIKDGEEFVVIDVRTPAETGVFGMALPDRLSIPADQLFQPENLDQLPADRPIIIMCQSGIRSVAVGTGLRHIGFDKVYILKGGFKALSSFLGPRQAYQ